MRGDGMLRLRLLVRPAGVAGFVAAVAGVVTLVAAYLPWYAVAAEVEMLGAARSRSVSTLAGWQAHPWGWVVPAIGVVVVVVGLALAVDRPLPATRDLLLGAGMALGGAVAAAGRWFPPVSRFDVGDSRLRQLADLADRLPRDVELSFRVQPATGLWLMLAAAAVMVVVGLLTRRLG